MSTAGRFTKLEKLGEGTYGVVYMAKEKQSGSLVALKRMNPAAEEEGVPATTIREICLLKELHHDNIVRLYDVMFQSPKLTLVFEYCEYDLKKYMDTRPSKKLELDSEVKPFLKQMLAGLQYMHAKQVVHRDLKPQNLLLTTNKELKLADYGLSRVEGIPVKKYTHEAVTLWYRSPDVILGSANYGLAVDIWSVGCIFAEMLTGAPLFNGHTDQEQLQKILRMLGAPTRENWPSLQTYPSTKALLPPESIRGEPPMFSDFVKTTELIQLSPEGLDLLRRMLLYEPSKRITALDALNHPFLQHIDDDPGAKSLKSMTNQLNQALAQLTVTSPNGLTPSGGDSALDVAIGRRQSLGQPSGHEATATTRTPVPPSSNPPAHRSTLVAQDAMR
jgi:cyclin-dependent kinase